MRFFLSGFVALLVQLLVYALVIVSLLPKPQKQYTFQEHTKIELIEIQDVVEKPKTTTPQITQPTKAPTPDLIKKIEPLAKTDSQKSAPKPSPVSGSDVKKLFERIDSANPPVLQENIEDERPLFSANAIKKQDYSFNQDTSQIKQETSKIKNAFDSLWENELQITAPQHQDISEGEYNEWFAKVKEILYAKWENIFYESMTFTINATISSDGSFSYRVIRYSKHQSYNIYMEEMLDRLKEEKFPPYPKGRITLEVVFKTKEHIDE